jgi:hypothetical protein
MQQQPQELWFVQVSLFQIVYTLSKN